LKVDDPQVFHVIPILGHLQHDVVGPIISVSKDQKGTTYKKKQAKNPYYSDSTLAFGAKEVEFLLNKWKSI